MLSDAQFFGAAGFVVVYLVCGTSAALSLESAKHDGVKRFAIGLLGTLLSIAGAFVVMGASKAAFAVAEDSYADGFSDAESMLYCDTNGGE